MLGVVLPQRVSLSPIANDSIITIKGLIINFSESAVGCFIPNTAAAGLAARDRETFPQFTDNRPTVVHTCQHW